MDARQCVICGAPIEGQPRSCPHCAADLLGLEQRAADASPRGHASSRAEAAGAAVLDRLGREDLDRAEHARAMASLEARERLGRLERERLVRDVLDGEPLRHTGMQELDHAWRQQPGESAYTHGLDQDIEQAKRDVSRLGPRASNAPTPVGYRPDAADANPAAWVTALGFLLGFVAFALWVTGSARRPTAIAAACGGALFGVGVAWNALRKR